LLAGHLKGNIFIGQTRPSFKEKEDQKKKYDVELCEGKFL
jgi:hypothetical protein